MKSSQLRVGAILSYVNIALGSLIPMFYTPIMLQILGQSEYGLYKLSSTVTSYLSLISFGIGSAVVRYLIKYRTEEDREGEEKIFGLFNIIFYIISLITLIVGVILAFNTELFYGDSLDGQQLTEMKILVILMTVNTAVSFSGSSYNAVVSSHEKFVFLQIINILTTVVNPIANIVALYLGFKSIGMAVVSLLIAIITRIAYTLYVRMRLDIKPRYKNMPVGIVKEILVFSFWIFLSNIVNQLYNSTDTLIIGAVPALSTVGVAVYNVGATFSGMMSNFTSGITNVLSPRITNTVFQGKNTEELTDLAIRYGRLQTYIVSLVCFGFIAFGQEFIGLWAGSGYEEAYWVAVIMMIPLCIPLIQSVMLNIIVAQNKHRFRSLVFAGVAVVNIIFTYLFVNDYGIIGAAVVSGVAYLIGPCIIMNIYYWKKIKLNIPRFWKNLLPLLITPFLLCVATLLSKRFVSFNNWVTLIAGILIFMIVFAFASWFFVFNDYEKDIFRAPIKNFIGKMKNHKRTKTERGK